MSCITTGNGVILLMHGVLLVIFLRDTEVLAYQVKCVETHNTSRSRKYASQRLRFEKEKFLAHPIAPNK